MRLGLILLPLLTVLSTATLRAEVYSTAEKTPALKVGTAAPSFTVRRADGGPFVFDSTRLTQPQVLIFYRGGWCPYCNMQLNDMRIVEPKLRAKGYQVLFLSTDLPALLYSTPKTGKLDYLLLSDNELKAAEAMHVAYHVDDATYAKQLTYGVDLEKTTGTSLHELPVPSVFIIDRAGVVRYVYSNPDYTVRLSGDELWAAVKTLDATPSATISKPTAGGR